MVRFNEALHDGENNHVCAEQQRRHHGGNDHVCSCGGKDGGRRETKGSTSRCSDASAGRIEEKVAAHEGVENVHEAEEPLVAEKTHGIY